MRTPTTPEGDLLRRARLRTVPRLSVKDAAARIGMSAEQYGTVERGHTRSREGQPPREFHAPAATVAAMAAGLNLDSRERAELEAARPDVVRVLADQAEATLAAVLERLVEELIADRTGDGNMLRYFWEEQLDPGGKPLPRAECARMMIDWLTRERERLRGSPRGRLKSSPA